MTITDIASICHEANRRLQQILGDPVSPPWDSLDAETQDSAVDGVIFALTGATSEQSHGNWLSFKLAHGWTYGPVKDLEAKTHPDLVPYAELPEGQKVKDRLFVAIVRTLKGEV